MRSARLIVCEKTGKWAHVLRGLVSLPQATVCETRSLAEARARLQESPAGVLAVECSAENWRDVCRGLPRLTGEFPRLRVVVLGQPSVRPAECLLRTAGAHHVAYSLIGMWDTSRWIVRHFEQVPQREEPVREWTWERLPWSPR